MRKRLIKALIKCAKSHHVDFGLYNEDPNDMQFCIMSANVPVVTDVSIITEAFFGSTRPVYVDRSWGTVTVFMDTLPFLEHEDEQMIAIALPYGTKL